MVLFISGGCLGFLPSTVSPYLDVYDMYLDRLFLAGSPILRLVVWVVDLLSYRTHVKVIFVGLHLFRQLNKWWSWSFYGADVLPLNSKPHKSLFGFDMISLFQRTPLQP